MIETPEIKNVTFEIALEKARKLSPLRQLREKFGVELGNLQFNVIPLQMAGKTLVGEKARIEGAIAKLNRDESEVLRELRQFFVSLVKETVQPMHKKIVADTPKRQRLRALLAEASAIYGDLEQIQRDWKIEVDALKKMARELSRETEESGDSYESYTNTIPEPPFVSPWVPAPTVQQIRRASNQGDNIASMLEEMARQIG
jgi:hypothetical protein